MALGAYPRTLSGSSALSAAVGATSLQGVTATGLGPVTNLVSSGASIKRTYRILHVAPNFASDMRFRYSNYTISSSDVEGGGTNTITVTAGLEYNGLSVQVTWNGATSITIATGKSAPLSDPISLDIPAGAGFYSRSCVSVGVAEIWAHTNVLTQNDSFGNEGNDDTLTTGVLPNVGAVTNNAIGCFSPVEIVGRTYPNTAASVICAGDSISVGQNDFMQRGGWFTRAFASARPWLNCSRGNTRLSQRIVAANTIERSKMYSDFKYAIIQLGINDASNGASSTTMLSNLATLVNIFRNRGIIVYVATLVPRTNTTDGWRTAANQTPNGTSETARVAYNDGVRAGVAGVSGVIDLADSVEVNSANVLTRNGGRWKSNETALDSGTATGTSSTTLGDTTKSWVTNQWAGYSVILTSGTGAGSATRIVSNTAISLGLTGDTGGTAGSGYVIQDTPTVDGTHPNASTNVLMAAAVPVSSFI